MAKELTSSTLGTPPDTYLYNLALAADTGVLATIGSDDSLRLFDASLKLLHTTAPCHAGVSCLEASNTSFVTAGRDGLIKVWHARGKQVAEVREPQGRGFSAIALHTDGHYVAAGTENTKEGLGDVGVLLYDLRNPSKPLRNYSESHNDTVTQLAFHPSEAHILLSGSTDGLVSLFDVNQEDEEDALQQVLNPRSAVHCAGFLTSDQVYVVTTDEHFSVHPLEEVAEGASIPIVDFGDVREALNCMYVIDVLQQPGNLPVVAHGHNEHKTLSITQLQGPDPWSFGQTVALEGAHGEEVVRDLLITPDQQRAYSCGEDGHVRVWDLAAAAAQTGGAVEPEVGSKGTKKKRREKKTERFAPY